MAGIQLHVTTGEIALASSAARTFQTLKAAAGHRVKVNSIGVFPKGTSATDPPVLVELIRASADFTGTPATNNPVLKNAGDPETVQTTGKKYAGGAVEPTYTTTVEAFEVHPQAGYKQFYPPGQELIIGNGGFLGIRLTTSAAITYLTTVELDIEE